MPLPRIAFTLGDLQLLPSTRNGPRACGILPQGTGIHAQENSHAPPWAFSACMAYVDVPGESDSNMFLGLEMKVVKCKQWRRRRRRAASCLALCLLTCFTLAIAEFTSPCQREKASEECARVQSTFIVRAPPPGGNMPWPVQTNDASVSRTLSGKTLCESDGNSRAMSRSHHLYVGTDATRERDSNHACPPTVSQTNKVSATFGQERRPEKSQFVSQTYKSPHKPLRKGWPEADSGSQKWEPKYEMKVDFKDYSKSSGCASDVEILEPAKYRKNKWHEIDQAGGLAQRKPLSPSDNRQRAHVQGKLESAATTTCPRLKLSKLDVGPGARVKSEARAHRSRTRLLASLLDKEEACGWCSKPCGGKWLMGYDTLHCSHECLRATEESLLVGSDPGDWHPDRSFISDLLAAIDV